jgi:hypothetical protein
LSLKPVTAKPFCVTQTAQGEKGSIDCGAQQRGAAHHQAIDSASRLRAIAQASLHHRELFAAKFYFSTPVLK